MIEVNEWEFEKRWVCGVVRSGFHNGSNCTPTEGEPQGHHDPSWGCGYRYEISWTEAKYLKRRERSEAP